MTDNEKKKTPKYSYLKKGGRIILIIFSILIICLIILLGVLLLISPGEPAPLTDGNGKILAGSISEKIFVNINGFRQGMFIKGRSTNNPVLLFLHGGPGMPTYFLAEKYPSGLEEKFIVCYWEQRGGGLSYNSDISEKNISVEQFISDAIEVTNYLRKRFGKEKIYLMGHSWGSFIGIQAAAKAPELFYAYIGVSQIANQAESEKLAYGYMLKQFEAAGDKSMVQKLKNYSPESGAAVIQYFKSPLRDEAMHELGIGTMHNMRSVITGIFLPVMQCRAYSLSEKINVWRAKSFLKNNTGLIDRLLSTDLTTVIPKIEIPVYFLCGSYDLTVNYNLSKTYFNHLEAPLKGFYTFSQSAHSAMHEEPERFMQIMVGDVLSGRNSLVDIK